MTKLNGLTLVAAALVAAAPAAAQDKPPPERSRAGEVARDIARDIVDAADAVGTVVGAVDDGIGGIRYRQEERFAIRRCAPRLARYGRMRIDHVEPYGRRSIRVYGTVEPDGWGDSRYARTRGDRSFACTVRDDGRVRVRTRRA